MLRLLFYLCTVIALTEAQSIVCGGNVCPVGMDCLTINGAQQCADPCGTYTSLNDAWRSINNTDQSNLRCDQHINWSGWYRFFLGQSSAQIPETCPEKNRCGTHAPLYITAAHPTQTNQIVPRTVCSHWSSSCCAFPSHTIQVKLCSGGFYVYKLAKPSVCHLAYCAEESQLIANNLRSSGQTENSITLEWSKPSHIVNYVLQFNGQELSFSSPSGVGPVTYNVTSLLPATKYTFTLYSVDGNVRSPGTQITAATAPENPQGFEAAEQKETSIALKWNKASNVSYVLQFNGQERAINASAASVTVSSLTPGTEYTFTLFSVFENIRSGGVQLKAVTDAAKRFTTARKFNISSCPVMFFEKKYEEVYVNFTNEHLAVCFNAFYNPDGSTDCILEPKADSNEAKFKISERDSSYESKATAALETIAGSMECYVAFDSVYGGKKIHLNLLSFGEHTALHFISESDGTKAAANVTVEGGLVGSVDVGTVNSGGFTDISGCRVSGVGIVPESTALFEKTCTSVTCSMNRTVTSTGCGDQEECDGHGVCFVTTICTLTGPTVIDFGGQLNTVVDRCSHSLLSDPSNGFQLFANFRERRRRDVSFLDALTLRLNDSGIDYQLEQGGRVKMNGNELSLSSLFQQFPKAQISKDKSGITAKFSTPTLKTTLLFDGHTALILLEASAGSSLDGLCVNSSHVSSTKLLQYSPPSCESQYSDPADEKINCSKITERCNLLRAEPFTSCNSEVDPTPYIEACKDTLCKYPSVDGLRCQFLWAYARSCSLKSNIQVGDWWAADRCSSPEAFCQDKTCSDHEFCGMKFTGKTGCLCRAVFADKYKQSETLGDPAVCKQSSASISLVGCLLEEKGINHSVLHLNDPSCRGEMDEETHMVTFSFGLNKQCGMTVEKNASQINYRNVITAQNNSDIIIRHDQVYIDFSCFHTQFEVRVVDFKVKDNSVVEHIKSAQWNYSLSMKAYMDAYRRKAIQSNSEVLLNQKTWVELETGGLDANTIAVVTDSCWATSQESSSSKPSYDLIIDGCPNPDDGTVQVEGNGKGTSNYFSFNMFEFSGRSGEIYLHCKVSLCPKRGNDCVPDCSGRGRRRRRSLKAAQIIKVRIL